MNFGVVDTTDSVKLFATMKLAVEYCQAKDESLQIWEFQGEDYYLYHFSGTELARRNFPKYYRGHRI